MALHVFYSTITPELFGVTLDRDGSNLPATRGPWRRAGDAIPLGVTMASTSPGMRQEINQAGFAVVENHTPTEPDVPRKEPKP
jgi:hypothetical protein